MGLVIGVSLLLRIAAVATAVSVVVGVPAAWVLVNRRFPGSRELGGLATAALALPAPVWCAYFWMGRPSLASWRLTAAAVMSAAPLLVRAGRTAFAGLDPLYGKAARSLGASDWRILWRVELPLIWRPALTGAAIAFARVLAECAAIAWIAPGLSR